MQRRAAIGLGGHRADVGQGEAARHHRDGHVGQLGGEQRRPGHRRRRAGDGSSFGGEYHEVERAHVRRRWRGRRILGERVERLVDDGLLTHRASRDPGGGDDDATLQRLERRQRQRFVVGHVDELGAGELVGDRAQVGGPPAADDDGTDVEGVRPGDGIATDPIRHASRAAAIAAARSARPSGGSATRRATCRRRARRGRFRPGGRPSSPAGRARRRARRGHRRPGRRWRARRPSRSRRRSSC